MENLGIYFSTFLLATFKFVLSAVPALSQGIPVVPTFITIVLGGLTSFNVFYFLSNYFTKRAFEKKLKRIAKQGYNSKKNFTKMNKRLVRLKMNKTGFWLLAILGPIFLSVPLGTIIVAKFYSHKRITYWVSAASIVTFGIIITTITQITIQWIR